MWVYQLKLKSEASEKLQLFNRKVKTIRTYRGGEFLSKEFQSFCERKGIKRQLTCAYTPHQNRVVERRNRSVIEMTHSLLKEQNLPNTFWGEAVNYSIYILNCSPTKALDMKTPEHIYLFRKKISY